MAKPSKNSRISPMLAAVLVMIATGCADRAIDPDAPAAYFFSDPKVAALAAAAAAGDVAKIDALVAGGVDVNATGQGNMTPLFRAIVAKNKAGYQALLRHGACPNILARVMAGQAAVIHYAASREDPFWLRLALKYGGDPNLKNEEGSDGQTPIFFAISTSFEMAHDRPQADNVRQLIEAGADVNAKWGRNKLPPLVGALKRNEYQIVYYLVQAGADTSFSCVEGWPLDKYLEYLRTNLDVVSSDQVEWFWKVVDLLNEQGANIQRETADSKKQSESDGVDDGKADQN